MTNAIKILSVMVTGLMLAACGGGSDHVSNSEPKPVPEPTENQNLGRLAVLNDDVERPKLGFYDVKDGTLINELTLNYVPSALQPSPQYRYAVLLGRANHQVNFVDSGSYFDRDQLKKDTPSLLSYTLTGIAPTHYNLNSGQAAIFYDGNAENPQARFDLLNDQGITTKAISSQTLPYNHHGVAVPREGYVLSSYKSTADEAIISVVKSYEQHNDHFHEAQTFDVSCPRIHGASSVGDYTGFGCADGMLLVEKNGNNFTAQKINVAYRISTVIGHDAAKDLVGLASEADSKKLFILNAQAKRLIELDWTQGNTNLSRVKQAYSATAAQFVLLDNMGNLHIFDAADWTLKHKITVFTPENITAVSQAQLIFSAQNNHLFINDVKQKQIIEIDVSEGKEIRRIQLDQTPQNLIWLGAQK